MLPTLYLSSVRRNEGSPLSRLKTLAYGDNIAAREEAVSAGYDDAVIMNNRGNVCCVSVGNLFVLLDGKLLTPIVSEGVLPGIVRQIVINLAIELGIPTLEAAFKPEELRPGVIFTTNSLQGLRRCQYGDASADQDLPQDVNLLHALIEGYDRLIDQQAERLDG